MRAQPTALGSCKSCWLGLGCHAFSLISREMTENEPRGRQHGFLLAGVAKGSIQNKVEMLLSKGNLEISQWFSVVHSLCHISHQALVSGVSCCATQACRREAREAPGGGGGGWRTAVVKGPRS